MRIREKLASISNVCNSWLRRCDGWCLQSLASVAESQQLNRPFSRRSDELKSTKVAIQLSRKSWGAILFPNKHLYEWRTDIQLIRAKHEREVYLYASIGDHCDSCANRLLCSSAKGWVTNLWCDLYSDRSCGWPGIGSVYLYGRNDGGQSRYSQGNAPVLDFIWWVGTGNCDLWWNGSCPSIIEYIHNRTGAKTLFATHYHELTALSETLSRLENVHVATLGEMDRLPSCTRLNLAQQISPKRIHVAKDRWFARRVVEAGGCDFDQARRTSPASTAGGCNS